MRPRNVLVLCAAVAAGIAGYALLSPSGLPKLRDKQADLADLEADVERLERENARLVAEASRLREDSPSADIYLEDAAREELGWVKPDEHVLLLDEGTREDASAEQPTRPRAEGEAP